MYRIFLDILKFCVDRSSQYLFPQTQPRLSPEPTPHLKATNLPYTSLQYFSFGVRYGGTQNHNSVIVGNVNEISSLLNVKTIDERELSTKCV